MNEISNSIVEIMSLLKQFIDSNDVSVIYINRIGNLIYFDTKGFEKQSFKMNSNSNFKDLYETIENKYASSFEFGFYHSKSYSLLLFIGEKVFVDMSSDNEYDIKWIFDTIEKHTSKSKKII